MSLEQHKGDPLIGAAQRAGGGGGRLVAFGALWGFFLGFVITASLCDCRHASPDADAADTVRDHGQRHAAFLGGCIQHRPLADCHRDGCTLWPQARACGHTRETGTQ